jgi:dCMP deaminase
MDRRRQKLEIFSEICKQVSKLSYDPKYKVGAIIITDDFREVCAIGYNGNYKGGPNQRENLDTGGSGFLHAEENALYHLTKPWNERENLIMIVTHKPCRMCLKRIVNSGIKTVYFLEDYEDKCDNSKSFIEDLPLSVHRL